MPREEISGKGATPSFFSFGFSNFVLYVFALYVMITTYQNPVSDL